MSHTPHLSRLDKPEAGVVEEVEGSEEAVVGGDESGEGDGGGKGG